MTPKPLPLRTILSNELERKAHLHNRIEDACRTAAQAEHPTPLFPLIDLVAFVCRPSRNAPDSQGIITGRQ